MADSHAVSPEQRNLVVFRKSFLPLSETFIADHIDTLREWRALIVCESLVDGGLKVDHLQPTRLFDPKGAALASARFTLLGSHRRLERLVESRDVRLIHAHFLPDGGRIATFARRHRSPLIVTAHGYDATVWPQTRAKSARERLASVLEGRLKRTVSRIVCVSEFIRGELVDRGYPPAKLVTIRLGVDPTRFQPGPPASSRTGVVFAGRLVEKKGLRYLLEAWPQLAPGSRATPLSIIGDGPLKPEMQRLATSLGVPAQFLGSKPRAEVLDLMRRSRVFAFPSTRATSGDAEGMGIVAVEAQALGTPVLAFDAHTGPEVLSNGHSGLLVAHGDRAAYAAALERLLTDDALADRLGAGGPPFVRERFDLRINTRRLEALYDEVVADAGGRA